SKATSPAPPRKETPGMEVRRTGQAETRASTNLLPTRALERQPVDLRHHRWRTAPRRSLCSALAVLYARETSRLPCCPARPTQTSVPHRNGMLGLLCNGLIHSIDPIHASRLHAIRNSMAKLNVDFRLLDVR